MEIINKLPIEDKKAIHNYIKLLEYSEGKVFVCDNCGVFEDNNSYDCRICKSWYCSNCAEINCSWCDIFFCLKCEKYQKCSSMDKILGDINIEICQECNERFCDACDGIINNICQNCWKRNANRNIKKAVKS